MNIQERKNKIINPSIPSISPPQEEHKVQFRGRRINLTDSANKKTECESTGN